MFAFPDLQVLASCAQMSSSVDWYFMNEHINCAAGKMILTTTLHTTIIKCNVTSSLQFVDKFVTRLETKPYLAYDVTNN